MFCNEPIQKVYELTLREDLQQDWHDYYFKITRRLEIHTTDSYWLLFETESFYITLGHNGVATYKKPYAFPKDRYMIDEMKIDETNGFKSEMPYYESVIFIGQHVRKVFKDANLSTVVFDDFHLDLYTYTEETIDRFPRSHGHTCKIVPVGTHVLNDCICGNRPEIYFNAVDDFFIRCPKCHTTTYANRFFKVCADDWNCGNTPISIENI